MSEFRFKAFISYNHADEAWASWLHKALESYRVPKRLSLAHREDPTRSRLAPVFRDRDELSSASDLSAKIKGALKDSDSLIVICSPGAARSRWVNEEIRYFRTLGRGDRIFCMIVDGDPEDANAKHNCFPPALLEEGVEPLAADARTWADGKQLAKLKLVSGILGVRLDELRQRETQRRRKRQLASGFAALVAVSLVLFSVRSYVERIEACVTWEKQRVAAEDMLARFLEASAQFEDVANLETRKAFGDVMSTYLSRLEPGNLSRESRRQLGVVLSKNGIILRSEGQLEQALDVFGRARSTLKSLVDNPNQDTQLQCSSSADSSPPGTGGTDKAALFELSQVEYWIGQINLDSGRFQEAETAFKAYADVAYALHAEEPGNASWTMEAAYAQSNLGKLERRRIPSDPRLTLAYFQSALELNVEAARLDPAFEVELAESHADVADAWLAVCELDHAVESRILSVELAAKYFEANPASNSLKLDYANALAGLSWVQLQKGQLAVVLNNHRKSIDLLDELVRKDASNLDMTWNLAVKKSNLALVLGLAGQEEASWEKSLAVEREFRELIRRQPDIRVDRAIDFGAFLANFANLATRRGDKARAERLLQESIGRLEDIVKAQPDNRKASTELAVTYFHQWEMHGGELPDESAKRWLDGVRAELNMESCSGRSLASKLAIMQGRKEEAGLHEAELHEKGYLEPRFREFCLKYGLGQIVENQGTDQSAPDN